MKQEPENSAHPADLQQHSGPDPSSSTTSDPHAFPVASIEELQQELPVVYDGQIPLGELLSRVVQTIYAELSELAEILPNMSDSARKRTLADMVVKNKKQVVKLYAVVKWARDADTVQKCMNITSFLMSQNQQFEDSIRSLAFAKEALDPARLRNHDLLTSLDVLTTGSYLRLPSCIKKMIVPTTPLSNAEVRKTLCDIEDVMRYRLRMSEIIPVEMSQYHIADGRVHFSVPNLFKTSLCLKGAEKNDGWFFVDVEFLINIGGDLTGLQEFPRVPTGLIKRHITDEADAQLAFYLPVPELNDQLPGTEVPRRPQLAENVVDTPLVRLYNFIQMMSLSYQLETLWFQAERMRSLGWAEHLAVKMSPDRKTMTVSYWTRSSSPVASSRPRQFPLLGGTLTIFIVDVSRSGPSVGRSSKAKVIARIQQRTKLGGARPSDEVEALKFEVRWAPANGALGVTVPADMVSVPEELLRVVPENLDFESMLSFVLKKHIAAILLAFQRQLQHNRTVFARPGVISLIEEGTSQALRVSMCADEVVIITVDLRTGRLNLRDTGDLAAAGRGPRFSVISEKLNENPTILLEALIHLRLSTILDLVEQKAKYLGLQSYRRRNFLKDETAKLGPSARGTLYIQLSKFPNHYLVLVITDQEFRCALITTSTQTASMYGSMIMEDIAWLDIDRIYGEDNREGGIDRNRIPTENDISGFNLDARLLRELYSYCCARVAFVIVETKFKLRNIPFSSVNPASDASMKPELMHIQSSLARSVPALCVQSKDILSGAPAEAAMPNIRVIPLNWWSEEKAQVVTCVKLKYVQQPMGKTAGSTAVIRPSKRIIYDTREAVVSFLSENVEDCVDEFLEEWARVSKMVVIAREVAQMSKDKNWPDIRLLSFDLQTVEFAYAADYTVSITCQDQLSPKGGNFDLRFSRVPLPSLDATEQDVFNPHDDAEPFFRDILRHGGQLAPSLHRLITLLRDTLPIVVELEEIRRRCELEGRNVDTFAKAAGWYRLLYGDLRHGLDFRLMEGQRVAILDSSHSLFETGYSNHEDPNSADNLGLQSIPNFREIVSQSVFDAVARNEIMPHTAVSIDVGIVCDAMAVGVIGRAIHAQVFAQFNS